MRGIEIPTGKRRFLICITSLVFYVCLLALILAFTGQVWGFPWFANILHKTTGGKNRLNMPIQDQLKQARKIVR